MDTQKAINTLLGIKATIDANQSGYKAQSDALQLAVDQLNGILVTQADDLKAQFENTIVDQENQIKDKDQVITDKDQKIADLQKQLDEKPTDPVDPIDPIDPIDFVVP